MNLKEIINEAFYGPTEVRPFDIMLMFQYWTNKNKGLSDTQAKVKAAQTAVSVAIRVMYGKKKTTPQQYVAKKVGQASIANKSKLSDEDWLKIWNKAVERLGAKWKTYLQQVKNLIEQGLDYAAIKKQLGIVSKIRKRT